MTKVDFDSLDRLTIKPLGIYGSRSKIIEYLYDKGVLSDPMYVCRSVSLTEIDVCVCSASVLDSSCDDTGIGLRAGIYILRLDGEPVLSVIFWPEDTTWHDDAVSSVCRNRVTFMRYALGVKSTITL